MQPPPTPPGASPPGLPPQKQFETHYQLANEFRKSGRHAAAAEQYQLALKTSGGREGERLEAKSWLGHSFLLVGHTPEALEAYSVVFQEAWHRPQFHRLAYEALYQSIECLHSIQRAEDQEEGAPLRRRLALIEEGLRWLQAIGKGSWYSALLMQKAFALWSLEKRAAALKEAEASFQLRRKEQDSPGYSLASLCQKVVSFARQLGEHQRGLEAIATLGGRYEGPDQEAKVLGEQALLLLALNPPQRDAAQVAARRAARLAREIQFPTVQLSAYAALGQSTLALARFRQAEEALERAFLIALEDITPNRPYLLREARWACQEAQDQLVAREPASRAQKLKRTVERIFFVNRPVSEPASRAHKLKCTLEQWSHELALALSS